MNNVMYFGYGHKEFGYDKELGHDLEVNFKEIEGAGIAIIRIEKKFPNDIKTEFHFLSPNSSENTTVSFDHDEIKNIKELVVAVLKEDNLGIDNTSISLNIN